MRQWHRWLGICFALCLLVIGLTGVAVQGLDTIATVLAKAPVATTIVTAPGVTAPDGTAPAGPKRPKMAGLRAWSHWIKDIHSGKAFGTPGTVLSILSGLALIFFALSGVWMYWQMFTRRKAAGRGAFFWAR